MAAGLIAPIITLHFPLPHVSTVFITPVNRCLTLCPVTVVPRCSIRPDKILPRVSPTSQPGETSIQSHHELMLLLRVKRDQVSLFLHTFILCLIPSFLLRKGLVR